MVQQGRASLAQLAVEATKRGDGTGECSTDTTRWGVSQWRQGCPARRVDALVRRTPTIRCRGWLPHQKLNTELVADSGSKSADLDTRTQRTDQRWSIVRETRSAPDPRSRVKLPNRALEGIAPQSTRTPPPRPVVVSRGSISFIVKPRPARGRVPRSARQRRPPVMGGKPGAGGELAFLPDPPREVRPWKHQNPLLPPREQTRLARTSRPAICLTWPPHPLDSPTAFKQGAPARTHVPTLVVTAPFVHTPRIAFAASTLYTSTHTCVCFLRRGCTKQLPSPFTTSACFTPAFPVFSPLPPSSSWLLSLLPPVWASVPPPLPPRRLALLPAGCRWSPRTRRAFA